MRSRTRLTSLAAAFALVVAGCGGGDEPQAGSDDAAGADGSAPIVLGGIFDLTGATGDVGTPYSEGVIDAVAQINADGGVDGRQLDLQSQDYQYDVAVAEQLYSQYQGAGAVAILGWGTADTEALVGRVTQDELPYFSGSLSENLADPAETPYNFLVGTTYSDQMRIALRTIAEESPGAQVAVLHNDSPFGESPLEDGRSYIEEAGLDIAGYETYPMPSGATDFVAELSRVQEQGATHIVVQNVASPAAQLASDIAAQGLEAELWCLNWCTDELFIELAGDAAEGARGVTPWAPASIDAEGLAPIDEYLQEAGETVAEKGGHYVQGWYYAQLMAVAIGDVIAGGEEPSGPAIKEVLENLEPYETGGVSPPVDFSPESHKGMLAAPVFEVTDGMWEPQGEAIEP